MNCVIVDDETTARVILKKLCSQIDNVNIVAEFENAIDVIKYVNNNPVDIILLDIHLQHLNGFDIIETFKNPPKIILISSDKSFAFDAFQHSCVVDYVSKPVSLERLTKAVNKSNIFLSQNQESENKAIETNLTFGDLFVNIDRRLIKITVDHISFIESKGDYINLKTEDKNYIVHSTLKNIHQKLPSNIFLRIHRSFVVNILKISSIEDNTAVINGKLIPIGRSHRSKLMQQLNLL